MRVNRVRKSLSSAYLPWSDRELNDSGVAIPDDEIRHKHDGKRRLQHSSLFIYQLFDTQRPHNWCAGCDMCVITSRSPAAH